MDGGSNVCAATWHDIPAEDRLSIDGDGVVVYELKHAFSDGTTHVLFEPVDL